jgi:hypothetical protein
MVLAQNSFAQPNFIYRHNRGKWRETGDGQRSRDANGPPQRSALKGQCQENFYFRLFHESSSTGAPFDFFENFRKYLQLKVQAAGIVHTQGSWSKMIYEQKQKSKTS